MTTCLMWPYLNVPMEGHVRQVLLYAISTLLISYFQGGNFCHHLKAWLSDIMLKRNLPAKVCLMRFSGFRWEDLNVKVYAVWWMDDRHQVMAKVSTLNLQDICTCAKCVHNTRICIFINFTKFSYSQTCFSDHLY
jgi:hypothetical protein